MIRTNIEVWKHISKKKSIFKNKWCANSNKKYKYQ